LIGAVAQDDLKTAIGRLVDAQIIGRNITREIAEMRVRSTFHGDDGQPISREDELVAHRERDGWKLVLGFPRRGGAAERHAAIEGVTRSIRAGAYQDRQAAMVAMANVLSRIGGAVR
jgi:hypothetical protein